MTARRPAPDRIDPDDTLPGEDGPLPYRTGRGPITEAEALGVARRLARRELASARRNTKLVVPDALAAPDAAKASHIFRLSGRDVAFARARAELEGLTLTDVIAAAIAAYGQGRPGEPTGFIVRPPVER